MKTNHQRQFKDARDSRKVFSKYLVFGETRQLPLSGRAVGAGVTSGDHTNGKRGIAKDRRGAKKYLNSRTRFHENKALQCVVSEVANNRENA